MTRSDDSAVPDYPGMLRMDGRGVVVIGAGQGIGRQACHALAQAGAKVCCVDLDPDLAADIAAEVGGVAWVGNATVRADAERLFAEAPALLARDRGHRPGRHRRHRGHGPVPRPARHRRRAVGLAPRHRAAPRLSGRVGRRAAPCATRAVGSWSSWPRRRASPPRRATPPTARPRPGSSVWCARPRSSSARSASASTPWRRASCGRRGCRGTWATRARPSTPPTRPLDRVALPQDIAAAIVFLASDLSAYVNGQVLSVDGGVGVKFPYPVPDNRGDRAPRRDGGATEPTGAVPGGGAVPAGMRVAGGAGSALPALRSP